MSNYFDTSFDSYFNEAQQNSGLTWLPWVGKNYAHSENRILIVGESYYSHETGMEAAKRDVERLQNSENIVRKLVTDYLDRGKWNVSTFENLHRALFSNNEIDGDSFWQEIAFFNFIQKVMMIRKSKPQKAEGITRQTRPTNLDFSNGWKSFISVIKILKPTTCLFIGTSAANSFNLAMQSMNLEFEKAQLDRKISTTYARLASVTINDTKTRLVFMRHSGSHFSWSKWHEYLRETIPQQMEYLASVAIHEKSSTK